LRALGLEFVASKGRFDKGYVNIDSIELVPSTLRIPTPNCELNIHIIYRGLYEVCAHCRNYTHTLNQCSCIPPIHKIEVMVEKLWCYGLLEHHSTHVAFSGDTFKSMKKWIRGFSKT